MKISSLILAAGSSSRLGSPKQLVEYQGEMLVSKITRVALAVTEEVLVVLGANEKLIRPELNNLLQENTSRLQIKTNPEWHKGMGNSISFGVQALSEKSDAILILLCDQPFVKQGIMQKMLQLFANQHHSIVACKYANQLGVPILFDKKYFPRLIQLDGDSGAKAILKDYRDEIISIDFPEGIYDIDTQEDINKLKTHNNA